VFLRFSANWSGRVLHFTQGNLRPHSAPSVKNKFKSIIKNTSGKNQYVKYRVHYSKEGNTGTHLITSALLASALADHFPMDSIH
jgi:hypothetical protein